MALGLAQAISMFGMTGQLVQVEAEVGNGLPGFSLIGLPDSALSEAKERVKSAVSNSGLDWPKRKLTVNLSPAAIRKYGSGFDLAIAVAVLATGYGFTKFSSADTLFLGELGLDGRIRPLLGVLPAVLNAQQQGIRKAFIPSANIAETKLLENIEIVPVDSLVQVAGALGILAGHRFEETLGKFEQQRNQETLHSLVTSGLPEQRYRPDFSEVCGQETLVRGLTIAAAGGHHALLVGPPGSGKTMMAERFAGILPRLSAQQATEVIAIHSLSPDSNPRIREVINEFHPPLSNPHHNASVSAMVGGGSPIPSPGSISLAHRGVLFLDEACEFQTPVLEALRQPLESGEVSIIRAGGKASFPARFQLLLAANPCPCGYALGGLKRCDCSFGQKLKYRAKLSGPLLDRIDIRLQVRAARHGKPAPTSRELSVMVANARDRALSRFTSHGFRTNAEAPGQVFQRLFPIGKAGKLLDAARQAGSMSMRGYERAFKLSWTIADLAGHDEPTADDVAEAMFFRGSDSPLDGGLN